MIFDFDALKAKDRYKLVVSTVIPRPIAWMVTRDAEGRINAAPYSFFNVFSHDPVTVVIGVGERPEGGSDKDTMANIRATGEFVVSLVTGATLEGMNVTAADFPPGVDELAEAGLTTAPSSRIGVPRIAESPMALECVTHQLVPVGPHTLVIGRVVAMYVQDDCMSDPSRFYVDSVKLDAVGRLWGAGGYVRLTDRVEVPRVTAAQWEQGRARRAAGD